MYIYIYGCYCYCRAPCGHRVLGFGPVDNGSRLGLYTILPSPILCGIYCNHRGSGVTLYCATVWAMTWGGGLNKGWVRKE